MSLLLNAWELGSPPTLHHDAIMRRMSSLYYKAIRFQVCGAVCASDHYKNTHSSGSQLSQESLPASNSVLDHLNIKVYTKVILSTEVEGLVYICILSSVPFTTLDGMSHSMFIPCSFHVHSRGTRPQRVDKWLPSYYPPDLYDDWAPFSEIIIEWS